ncbi:TetR family transcriptional regulator [Cellulomonas hominis]|uniref:TetR family transcriptional regulator n=1 Tax=Cellulomonas hominis TaxID=156981 RepID=A0A7Z8K1K4_9CELL|nr:TetR/AcrR family transcriptional regulator [Cellulomonas hominis]TKR27084.1 TetR family transcriptional regulator [Cellulomonas hominis]
MARRQDDETPDGRTVDDSIGAATRALADATAALTRLIGRQVQSVVPEVSDAVAASLREASRGLADASESVGRRSGGRAEERRTERANRTREELLDAAARAFARHGYEGASLGDIAADAGYTKGAVYAHFGSKHELFLEVARRQIAAAPVQPCLPDLGSDGLEAELSAALHGMVDEDDLLLSLEILSFAVRHPEARAEIGGFYEDGFAELAEQVARARHPADPAPAEADWDTALAVVSVSNIALLLGAVTGSPHASPAAGSRVIARLLRG